MVDSLVAAAAINVIASEEDIFQAIFSILTLNKKLEIITERSTPELKLVQKTKAFERHFNYLKGISTITIPVDEEISKEQKL